MRLTRAAFAVIIKFSDQISIFQQLWDAAEFQALQLEEVISDEARCKALAEVLEFSDTKFLVDTLCDQWMKASLIRKYTQEMKKDLTEALKQECKDDLVLEINKELKAAKIRERQEEQAKARAQEEEKEE